jgi:hypothetical protein
MIGGVCLVVTRRQNAVCCVIKGGNRNDCDRAKRIPLFMQAADTRESVVRR